MGSSRHLIGLLCAALIGAVEALLTRIVGLSGTWSLVIAGLTLLILAPTLAGWVLIRPARLRSDHQDGPGTVIVATPALADQHYVTAIELVSRDRHVLWHDYVVHEAGRPRRWEPGTVDLHAGTATVRPRRKSSGSTPYKALQPG
jgi:hypothetical protein